MLRFPALILTSALVIGAGVVAAQTPRAHPVAKVFKGAEGERMTMVYLEPRAKDQLLIKLQGIEGEWDNTVLLHQRVSLGNQRENYELLNVKTDPNYVTVVWRGGAYEVYPKGSKRAPIRMSYVETESARVDVTAIVDEYTRRQRSN